MSGLRRILFLIFSAFLILFAVFKSPPVETNLANAFVNPTSNVAKLADLSSRNLNIILEVNSKDALVEAKSEFKENSHSVDFLGVYKDYPTNFLSAETRKLLEENNYSKLRENAYNRLYNPLGIYISPPNKDPYLLATDYVLSLTDFEEQEKFENGKFYSLINVKIKDKNDIEKYLALKEGQGQMRGQGQFKRQSEGQEGVNVYFAGAPIHSHITSKKSILEINLICLISTLALALLCRFCFKTFKILIPIWGSILFGFVFGCYVCAMFFPKLHILTFVFSTSIIGISLDYSLHYFMNGEEKDFRKNLTASMLTTSIAFLMLGFSQIEILKQIAIFTSSGLFGVYLFVIIFLNSKFRHVEFSLPKIKFRPYYLLLFLAIIALGLIRLNFNDSLQNLYKPQKELLKSEILYKNLFQNTPKEFLLIEGKSVDEILEREENLKLEGALGLSNFVSSSKKQRENFELVQKLYEKDLDGYAKFLSPELRKVLKEESFKAYDTEKFPLNQEFMLDDETSFIVVPKHVEGSISPSEEISKHLKAARKSCVKFLPCVFGVLFLILGVFYGVKNALRIILSPFWGCLISISIISLLGQSLNLFNILALFLVVGFSIDYSIFRLNCGKKSETAVLISVLSTALSFLLLSFTCFKLISSLALTLFLGIVSSYITSLFMIKSKHE